MHFVDAKGILIGSGGRYGMNIYRGCTHGCIYCDSRSRFYQFRTRSRTSRSSGTRPSFWRRRCGQSVSRA